MSIRDLFTFPIDAVVNSRGELYTLQRNYALSEAIKVWLYSKPGDLVGNPEFGGFPYIFLNSPLTTENANAMKNWITSSLATQFFDVRLEIQTLEVSPNLITRTWEVYGSFYAPDYAALATVQASYAAIT